MVHRIVSAPLILASTLLSPLSFAFSPHHPSRLPLPASSVPLHAIDVSVLSPDVAAAAATLSASSSSLPHLPSWLEPSSSSPPSLLNFLTPVITWISVVFWCDRPKGLLLVPPSHLLVSPSSVPGAGAGLFAAAPMSDGTVLGTYPGVERDAESFVTTKMQDAPRCADYVWRFGDDAVVLDPTDAGGEVGEVLYGGAPYVPLSDLIMGPGLLGRFVNVNTALCRINEPPPDGGGDRVNVRVIEDIQKRTVAMILSRDVEVGEELFMDYGKTYDRSTYGESS